MALMFSLMPATVFLVIGFFVFFCATKGQGFIRKLGQVLAIWLFIIALCIVTCGAYVTITGKCPVMGEECPIYQMMKSAEMPAGTGGEK